MKRSLLLAVLFLASTVFAGCLDGSTATPKARDLHLSPGLRAGAPLWNDPQNTPLPSFDWPTLSSPPNATDLPPFWKPIPAAPLPSMIRGLTHVAQSPDAIRSGAGIALFGSLAIVPGYGKPSAIFDISDPVHPKVLSTFMPQEGMGSHRGATTIAYPDGRLVTVISTGSGLDVWNITDPTHPEGLPPIKVKSHKVGVVPGTPIVYNAASGGGGYPYGEMDSTATGVTEIYDLFDPANAVKVQDWKNGFSCHHVYFWNDPAHDKYRGICAGSQFAQLWDTKDPRHPTVIVSVPIPQGVKGTPAAGLGVAVWAHYAGLSKDGKILIVGDELEGGGAPPGCTISYTTPQGTISAPTGALWFYDVSTETNPRLLGWFSVQDDPRTHAAATTSCTAHHGRLVPDPQGRDLIAMSFYGGGVNLIDFTGVNFQAGRLPRLVDSWADGSDTWETWYDQGYLFTGDLARGLDVLTFK